MRLLLIAVLLLFLPVAAMAQSAGQKLGGGGGGVPGGIDTQVQFYDGGVNGGDSGFTYIKGTQVMSVNRLTTADISGDNGLVLFPNDTAGYTTSVTAGNLVLVNDPFADSGAHAGKFTLFNNADGLVGDMMNLDTNGHYRNCATGSNNPFTDLSDGTADDWCLNETGNHRTTGYQIWDAVNTTPTRWINVLRTAAAVVDETTANEITTATWRIYGDGGFEDRLVLESDGTMNFMKGDGAAGITLRLTNLASSGTALMPGDVTGDIIVTLPVEAGTLGLRRGFSAFTTTSALSVFDVQGGRITVTGGSGIVLTLPDTAEEMDVCIINGVAQTLSIDVNSSSDKILLPFAGFLTLGDKITAPVSPNDIGASICLYTDAGDNWYTYAMVGIWTDGGP